MTTAAKVTTPITSKAAGSVGSKRLYAGNDGEQPSSQTNSRSGPAGLVVAAAAGALWWRWTPLTTEHDPTKLPSERQRVEATGGRCFDTGHELRVFPANMTIEEARRDKLTLNMSRALGHLTLSRAGISAEPDLITVPLSPWASAVPPLVVPAALEPVATPKFASGRARRHVAPMVTTAAQAQSGGAQGLWTWPLSSSSSLSAKATVAAAQALPMRVLDRFLVTGSDGLWDMLSAAEVAQLLHTHRADSDATTACLAIAAAADAKWKKCNASAIEHGNPQCGDNITLLCVHMFCGEE